MKLVLASHNRKKVAELSRILGPLADGFEVLSLDDVPPYDEPAETESTFSGNALLKARIAAAHTGLAAVADDSGLCIDALNGMPGVLSARWAGRSKSDTANLELVLEQLYDVPDSRRGAAFECRVALVLPAPPESPESPDGAGQAEHVVEGRLPGRIDRAPRGSHGFGYDPIFVPDGYTQTLAELDAEAKDAISHRGRALRALAEVLAGLR